MLVRRGAQSLPYQWKQKNRKVANCSSREKIDLPNKNSKLNTKMKLIFAFDFHWNRLKTMCENLLVATTLLTVCRWQTCQNIPPPHTEYKTYVQKTLLFCPSWHCHLPGVNQASGGNGQPWEDTSPVAWGQESLFLGTTFHQRDFVLVALNLSGAIDSHSLASDLIS